MIEDFDRRVDQCWYVRHERGEQRRDNMRALILAFVLIISNVPFSQAATSSRLVGTWRATAITEASKQQVEIVIQANGTYSQQWRGQNVLNTFTGSWRPMGGGLVRFDIDDWQPRKWCGPVGLAEILRPPGTTARIKLQTGANSYRATPNRR